MGIGSKNAPAVFLDRDGTIIKLVDHLHKVRDVRLLRGAAQAIKLLNRAGFYVIIITNQPAIARGFIEEKGVHEIHRVLLARLRRRGARIDGIYFCPHVHEDGCVCRKPKLGMMRQAAKQFAIDMRRSFFVGDHLRDIETGRRAKVKTILVKTGNAGKDTRFFTPKVDFIVKDLLSAARIITRVSRRQK